MKFWFSSEKIWREVIVLARFGMVGVLATIVHITIIWLLLLFTPLPPVLANTLAFLTAFGISFVGNYYWTFGSSGEFDSVLKRFLLISLSAFGLNTLILVCLVRSEWFSPVISAIFSASVVPLISFVACRFWGFRSKKRFF